jgi:hypothetical protein
MPNRVNANRKAVDGWQIKNWVDWSFAVVSFLAFLALEGAIVYSYFVLLGVIR